MYEFTRVFPSVLLFKTYRLTEYILILLHKYSKEVTATLDFEFICTSCKHTHPIYDNRCPHCHNILTFNVNHTLSKSLDQATQSLQ